MKTSEQLERRREAILTKYKQRAEMLLGVELVIIGEDIRWDNVERKHPDGDWEQYLFPDFNFDYYDYRLIPKPEIVDLDFSDNLIGQVAVYNGNGNNGFKGLIIAQDNDEVLIGTTWVSYEYLRRDYTRPDGTKFEKVKE